MRLDSERFGFASLGVIMAGLLVVFAYNCVERLSQPRSKYPAPGTPTYTHGSFVTPDGVTHTTTTIRWANGRVETLIDGKPND